LFDERPIHTTDIRDMNVRVKQMSIIGNITNYPFSCTDTDPCIDASDTVTLLALCNTLATTTAQLERQKMLLRRAVASAEKALGMCLRDDERICDDNTAMSGEHERLLHWLNIAQTRLSKVSSMISDHN